MKYKYVHKKSFVYLIFIAIFLITALMAYYVMRWLRLFNLYSVSLAFEIPVVALGISVILILLSLLGLSYKISDSQITLRVIFFDTFMNQLKMSMIYKLVWNKRDNRLVVCFTDNKMEQQIAFINIDPKRYDAFAADIRKANPKIIYETADM